MEAAAATSTTQDGVPPIELIDGERLVSLFEMYELGLRAETVYELLPEFFRSFESYATPQGHHKPA